jgi:hypothetical protein
MWREIAVLLISVMAAGGCSNPPPPGVVYCPTTGTITYNGNPPKGAVITFHAVTAEEDSNEPVAKPQAKVQKDGSFRLDGETKEEGLPPGVYVLTITWRPNAACPDLFQGRYTDEASPILWATIEKGPNQLPLIELTGPEVDPDNPLGTD